MGKKVLHPSVVQFKNFVKEHPKIIQEVRNKKFTWQELYEDWYLLGEEDPRWDEFRNENEKNKDVETKTDWVGQILGAVKRMDPNQIEGHINNLSQAIEAIQGVITQFQGINQANNPPKNQKPQNPFMFRKD